MNDDPHCDFIDNFKARIARHIGSMYRYAYVLCRDGKLAEDIAHDACVNLFKSDRALGVLADSGPETNFEAYAMTAVANAYRDYLRAPHKRTGRSEAPLPDDEGHRIFHVADHAAATITSIDLQTALLRLDDDDRTLIFLRYYEGRSIADAVQAATGVTGGRAFRRHTQVLDRLRQFLTGKPGGE